MIRKLIVLVCGLAITGTLTACGSSENSENTQNKEESSSMMTELSTEVQKEADQSVETSGEESVEESMEISTEMPAETEESVVKDTEEEIPVSNLDLDEARKWIYVPAECYAEDGSVIWEGDRAAYTTIFRYYEEDIPYDKLAERLNYVVEEYKAHGYAYVGDESDILSLNRDVFEKYGSICFKLELIDPVLLADLERTVLNAYIASGKSVPEGDDYDAFMDSLKKHVKDFSTIAIRVGDISWEKTHYIEVYGRFRFGKTGFVQLTENWDYCADWLEYNENYKIWHMPED